MSVEQGLVRWKGRVAVVTGASAGMGYETAKQLALSGMTVVGCARNTSKIEGLSSELSKKGTGKLVAIKCDVSKEEEVLAMFEQVKRELGGADVIICNAGLGWNEPLLSGNTSQWREMMEVNVIALCVCTREFFKQAKERGMDDGHIFLLNSVVGHLVTPQIPNFYTATKYAVTAITEGLRQELREMKSGIKVTSISPGIVRTEFIPRMVKDEKKGEKMIDQLVDGVPLEMEDIASCILYALSTPPRMQIHDILVRPTNEVF